MKSSFTPLYSSLKRLGFSGHYFFPLISVALAILIFENKNGLKIIHWVILFLKNFIKSVLNKSPDLRIHFCNGFWLKFVKKVFFFSQDIYLRIF